MIRQVRGDGMQDIKKAFEEKELSEDQREMQEKQLQKITDEFTTKIEEMGDKKEQELRTI
jgi:ribosome recycling factor